MAILRRIAAVLQVTFPRLIFRRTSCGHVVHLGSEYGGWSFVDSGALSQGNVLAVGMGEDISFEMEIANAYSTTLFLVDPTPRAIEHLGRVRQSMGSARMRAYEPGGRQPVNAYPLENVTNEMVRHKAVALAARSGEEVRFWAPDNPEYVSYSLSNIWGNDTSCKFLTVRTRNLQDLMSEFEIRDLEILKLDIEGAEVEVLKSLAQSKIRPRQILVEYDEFFVVKPAAWWKIWRVHRLLVAEGYSVVALEGLADVSYFKVPRAKSGSKSKKWDL